MIKMKLIMMMMMMMMMIMMMMMMTKMMIMMMIMMIMMIMMMMIILIIIIIMIINMITELQLSMDTVIPLRLSRRKRYARLYIIPCGSFSSIRVSHGATFKQPSGQDHTDGWCRALRELFEYLEHDLPECSLWSTN